MTKIEGLHAPLIHRYFDVVGFIAIPTTFLIRRIYDYAVPEFPGILADLTSVPNPAQIAIAEGCMVFTQPRSKEIQNPITAFTGVQ